MRHLFLFDPSDEKTFDIEDEYMLGGALLVAPVLRRRNKRCIYLPKGQWINIFNGKEYKGSQVLRNYKVPLESVPVFRLAGAQSACLDEVLENAKPLLNKINELSKRK